MNKRTCSLILSLLIVCLSTSFAQQINISGKITDAHSNPIGFANINLLTEDSVFIGNTASDIKGIIKIKAEANKNYRIIVSAMGYLSAVIHIKETNEDLFLGDILLTEKTVELDNVTVTANRSIYQIDRQINYPSPLIRQSSTNAFDLLYKMALPRVIVNTTDKSIKLMGSESIKLRINGIDANMNEISAIPASEIIRIDYYDNPGVRVKENAIIDFIVKRRVSGGYLSTDLTNSPHVGFGNDMFAFKSNYKNSEWGAFYNLSYRSYKKRETFSTTEYHFPGESFTQQTDGIPSAFNYQTHDLNLNYNYTLTDKRVFNVTMSGTFNNNRGHDRFINYYSDKSGVAFPTKIESRSKEKNPVIDLYYKEELPKSQTLFFNVVSGYINTNYLRNYQEDGSTAGQSTIINSLVNGEKYSVISEGNHQKRWNNLLLYSGIKYIWGYTKNNYEGTVAENTSLTNKDLYFYSQLQGKFNKISFTLGVGASYSYFNDQANRFKFWTFRPTLSLAYQANDCFYMKYSFDVDQSTPSLSQLNDVSQVIDQYRIQKGNPNLKPYRIYNNVLQFNYQKNSMQIYFGVVHQFNSKAIMTENYADLSELKIIQTSINQKYYQTIQGYAGTNFEILKDILSLSLYTQISWTDSKGINYQHKYKSIFGGGQVNFNLKQWSANVGINSRNNYLWGETIFYGEWSSTAEVGYKYKALYLGASVINFLTDKWSAGNKNLSRLTPGTTWTYIDDSAPIFCLKLSWNFNWGKQSKAEQKKLQNKDSDSGVMKVQ